MGCGCSSNTGNNNVSRLSRSTQTPQNQVQQLSQEPCEFTVEMVSGWLDKALCFKSKGLYVTMPNIPKRKLNAYIGTLMSALNKKTNLCYFENQLLEIQAFIIIVTSTGQC